MPKLLFILVRDDDKSQLFGCAHCKCSWQKPLHWPKSPTTSLVSHQVYYRLVKSLAFPIEMFEVAKPIITVYGSTWLKFWRSNGRRHQDAQWFTNQRIHTWTPCEDPYLTRGWKEASTPMKSIGETVLLLNTTPIKSCHLRNRVVQCRYDCFFFMISSEVIRPSHGRENWPWVLQGESKALPNTTFQRSTLDNQWS